jgi:sodium/hydrogen antiporter
LSVETASTVALIPTLALIGAVILIASLLSGVIERSGVPQVAIFIALGAVVGPFGLALVDFGLESGTLRVIATLALALVLFMDAISVNVSQIKRYSRLALLVLGPGTFIPAALIALAAWALLDLSPAASAILGAALASTDPVLLRGLLRHPDLPATARIALRLESGMNDVVLLPVVVIAMVLSGTVPGSEAGAVTAAAGSTEHVAPASIGRHLIGLFLLGPGLGVVVGWMGITALEKVRAVTGMRRDYESLYAIGIALLAFTAAEAVGGSGFLSAFAAGLIIASLDVQLCDCFFDYGEATAEMLLLLTFVAFGASLIWTGLSVIDARTLIFATVAMLVRTAVLAPVLRQSELDPRSRRIVAWFGPRGLSSLLLVLLPVFVGMPGADRLFAIACLVVLLSLVLHGAGIAVFMKKVVRHAARVAADAATDAAAAVPASYAPLGEPPHAVAPNCPAVPGTDDVPERLAIEELRELWRRGEPVVVIDTRKDRALETDARRAMGAYRLNPDDSVREAERLRLPRDATIALFCA